MREALETIARTAAAVGIRSVNFRVDDAATEAIAALPGATVLETVYVHPSETYVIRSAVVYLDGVELHAQAHHRPATEAEVAGAALHDYVEKAYRAGDVAA